jgi:hypothetical protein
MNPRKAAKNPRASTRNGVAHRQERHLPSVQGTSALDEGSGAAAQEKIPKGGRPKIFDVPTARLNLFLPLDTVKHIRMMAVQGGVSPSQLVDDWAKKADLIQGIARGDRDFSEGRVVSQEEAERRLAKWG